MKPSIHVPFTPSRETSVPHGLHSRGIGPEAVLGRIGARPKAARGDNGILALTDEHDKSFHCCYMTCRPCTCSSLQQQVQGFSSTREFDGRDRKPPHRLLPVNRPVLSSNLRLFATRSLWSANEAARASPSVAAPSMRATIFLVFSRR